MLRFNNNLKFKKNSFGEEVLFARALILSECSFDISSLSSSLCDFRRSLESLDAKLLKLAELDVYSVVPDINSSLVSLFSSVDKLRLHVADVPIVIPSCVTFYSR